MFYVLPLKLMTDSLAYRIITVTGGTYGYDIFKNRRLVIHQPVIPAWAA